MADELTDQELTRDELEIELNSLREEYIRLQDHLADIELKYQSVLVCDTEVNQSNKFLATLKSAIAELFNNPLYSDLRILLENGGQCYGHKILFSIRGSYWGVNDLAETDHLNLSDIKYDIAMAMLRWVYTDDIETSTDEEFLKNLLQVSARFHLDSLKQRVEKMLIMIISDTNCQELYEISKQLQCRLLKEFTIEFIRQIKKKSSAKTDGESSEEVEKARVETEMKPGQEANIEEVLDSKETLIDSSSSKDADSRTESEPPKVYDCKECSKSFTKPYSLKRHSITHLGLKPFVCEYCQKAYAEKSSMWKHQRQTHPESIKHIMEEKELKEKKLLAEVGLVERPSETEVDENVCAPGIPRKPYKCKLCHKSFSKRYPLKRHMDTHKGLKPYTCPYCAKAYAENRTMRNHIMTVHNESEEKSDRKPIKKLGNTPNPLTPKSETKILQCDFCSAKYSKKKDLMAHRFKHTGETPYKCDKCSRSFGHRESLRVHLRVHTGEKPFQCDGCGRCFAEKCQLRQHSRVHTGAMPFQCKICHRPFRHRESLVVHLRLHSDERPYQCDLCGKSFRASGGLKGHMRTHTGEKPCTCEVCGKGFRDKGHMRRHRKIHDKEQYPHSKSTADVIEAIDIEKLEIPVQETITIQNLTDSNGNRIVAEEIQEIPNLEAVEHVEYHIENGGSIPIQNLREGRNIQYETTDGSLIQLQTYEVV